MKPVAVIVAVLAGLSAATPQREGRKVVVTFCTRPKLNGNCKIIDDFSTGECGVVGARLAARAQSISYDSNLRCTFYEDNNCSGNGFTPASAGTIDDIDRDWGTNRNPTSFLCDRQRRP